MKIGDAIRNWAKKKDYRVAPGGTSILEEMRTTLRKRRDEGEIDAGFFRGNLDVFTYLEGCSIKNPRSVLIVAVPLPAHILSFSVAGKSVKTILPPTYVRYGRIFEEVRDDLGAALAGLDCCLELLSAPLKALGSRLGLLSYGRNNIGYIDGLGSYFQLVGLVLDKRLDPECLPAAIAEKLLQRCRDCQICVKACPTGAIDRDRFLLHAEKCYTLFSESLTPIPEGFKPPSPKCLIGCLRCQQVCPENRGLLRYEEAAVSFDAEETEAFLSQSQGPEGISDRVKEKFLKLGLTEGLPVFSRNLERMLKLRRY
jgi:epoxyqueuosine reductase